MDKANVYILNFDLRNKQRSLLETEKRFFSYDYVYVEFVMTVVNVVGQKMRNFHALNLMSLFYPQFGFYDNIY